MTELIPLSAILILDRQRISIHDNGLKDSLLRLGTIQPVVLAEIPQTPEGHTHRLVAGGRRIHFLRELGHEFLYHASVGDPKRPGFVFRAELPEDELQELEYEENARRDDITWQEKVLAVAKLHRLKTIKYGEAGKSWTQRMCGEFLNTNVSTINYSLSLADFLRDPKSPLWQVQTYTDGCRWILQQLENRGHEQLAKMQVEATALAAPQNKDVTAVLEMFESPNVQIDDAEKEAARERYLFNPLNDPNKFEEYWSERCADRAKPQPIYITPRWHNVDCLSFLKDWVGKIDHIITDPPYAIDMDMLKQDNQGMANIDSVRETHDVAENVNLLQRFIPLAYSALKESGFLVMWCDFDMWADMSRWADKAGFKVQRWPITWVKTHPCMNSAAQFNFTKTTEIAMVCRKGNALMARQNSPAHVIASHDEYKENMDHPFVKPFAVWEHIIRSVTLEGQTILDPFAGELSGPLSFLRCQRNYLACEKDPVHYNKGMENLKKYFTQGWPFSLNQQNVTFL